MRIDRDDFHKYLSLHLEAGPSVRLEEPTVIYAPELGTIDLGEPETGFSETAVQLALQKFASLSEFAQQARLSRQVVSLMNTDASYLPKKRNAFACVIGLRLNEAEARDLLQRGSYTFSKSSPLDLTVLYCIQHGIYDIDLINELLFEIDQPLLGSI